MSKRLSFLRHPLDYQILNNENNNEILSPGKILFDRNPDRSSFLKKKESERYVHV